MDFANRYFFWAGAYVPQGMSRDELRSLHRKAFLRFYLRPRILLANGRYLFKPRVMKHALKYLLRRFQHLRVGGSSPPSAGGDMAGYKLMARAITEIRSFFFDLWRPGVVAVLDGEAQAQGCGHRRFDTDGGVDQVAIEIVELGHILRCLPELRRWAEPVLEGICQAQAEFIVRIQGRQAPVGSSS